MRKQKIIIIGMDNTGKTTLAEYLAKELNLKLIKSTGPGLSKENMINHMLDNLNSPEKLIFERFNFFEELIYGKILRNNSKFKLSDSIYKKIINYNPIIIYSRPKEEKIFNFGTREQMKGVIEEKEKLLKSWDELFLTIQKDINVYRYDFDIQSLEFMKNYINQQLKEKR